MEPWSGQESRQQTDGADLQWLVGTGGDHDADSVARAIGRRLGTMVTGAPVWAHRPQNTKKVHNLRNQQPILKDANI